VTELCWNFEMGGAGDTRQYGKGMDICTTQLALVKTSKIPQNIALTYKHSHLGRSANTIYILFNCLNVTDKLSIRLNPQLKLKYVIKQIKK